jgi:hypothetical protein
MNPLRRAFYSEENISYLHALAQRIADVSDVVDTSFTRQEIIKDMGRTFTLYDGSVNMELMKSGASLGQMMKEQNTSVGAKLQKLNYLAEQEIRTRIRSRMADALLLKKLGIGLPSSRSAGLNTLRPFVQPQRPAVIPRTKRGSKPRPGGNAMDIAIDAQYISA